MGYVIIKRYEVDKFCYNVKLNQKQFNGDSDNPQSENEVT